MTLKLAFNDTYHLWAGLVHQKTDRVFVASSEPAALGSEVPVEVLLPDLPIRMVLNGMVVGLRPASDRFPAGIFVRFADAEIGKARSFLGLSPLPVDTDLGRRAIRVDCDLPLKILEPISAPMCRAKNLSETGILASCQQSLTLGQRVRIELSLDDGAVISTQAEVIWSRHEIRMVGLSFMGLSAVNRPVLLKNIQGRLAAEAMKKASLRTIVLVEDNLKLLELATNELTRNGYDIHRLTKGEEAIPTIRRVKPSMVILDILMPGIDGRDICRRMRADSEMSTIPVVLVSGLDKDALHAVAQDCGASDYLQKPYAMPELLSLVRRLMPKVDRP